MSLPSSSVPASGSSVPKVSTGVKRAKVLSYLTMTNRPSLKEIARLCGVSERSVNTYWKGFRTGSNDWLTADGRKSNGRKSSFEKWWPLVLELKRSHKDWGGQGIYEALMLLPGVDVEELPSCERINDYLSSRKETRIIAKGNPRDGFWMYDKLEAPLDLVGMDEVYPLPTSRGVDLKCVCLRDWYSRATYLEAFPFVKVNGDGRNNMSGNLYASILWAFVYHFGIPKRVRFDNGSLARPGFGYCSEIMRLCFDLGIIVEFEPHGEPTGNSAVERWNGTLQNWWRSAKKDAPTVEAASELLRRKAWMQNFAHPVKNLGDKTVCQRMPVKPFSGAGRNEEVPQYETRGVKGFTEAGGIALHRRVEQAGMVRLWDEQFIRVSPALAGAKCVVELMVCVGGGGSGRVRIEHGEVVAQFRHRLEEGIKADERLVYDVELWGYDADEDTTSGYSQETQDEKLRRAMKRKPSPAFARSMQIVVEGGEAARDLLDPGEVGPNG